MPGVAKTRKPYWINVNRETTFKTERTPPSNQTAISGEIQETPSFTPKNEPIKTKRHSEIGANATILKGREAGELSWSETVQDWRPVARILGVTLDMVRIIKGLEIASGTNIQTDDDVTGDDGSEGLIERITIPIDGITGGTGTFEVGETITYDTDKSATVERVTIASGAVSGTITLSGMTSVFTDDLSFVGDTGATTAIANLAVGQTIDIWLKQFTWKEALTFVGSSETATELTKIEGSTAAILGSSGAIVDTDVMTGDTSGARAGITTVTSQTELILTPFILIELISISTATPFVFVDSSQTVLIYQHQLHAYREYNSYTLNYALESLANQHLNEGCVIKQLGIESAVNEAPKFNEDWLLAKSEDDPTIDAEVLNTHALYQYTDVADTLNGISYTNVLKTVNMTINRTNLIPIDSHQSLQPTGFKGAEVETTFEFGIHRENEVLLDYRVNDTLFPLILAFTRGIVGEDDATAYADECKMLEPTEEGEETIYLTLPIEIQGTPYFIINDDVADYSL